MKRQMSYNILAAVHLADASKMFAYLLCLWPWQWRQINFSNLSISLTHECAEFLIYFWGQRVTCFWNGEVLSQAYDSSNFFCLHAITDIRDTRKYIISHHPGIWSLRFGWRRLKFLLDAKDSLFHSVKMSKEYFFPVSDLSVWNTT